MAGLKYQLNHSGLSAENISYLAGNQEIKISKIIIFFSTTAPD